MILNSNAKHKYHRKLPCFSPHQTNSSNILSNRNSYFCSLPFLHPLLHPSSAPPVHYTFPPCPSFNHPASALSCPVLPSVPHPNHPPPPHITTHPAQSPPAMPPFLSTSRCTPSCTSLGLNGLSISALPVLIASPSRPLLRNSYG